MSNPLTFPPPSSPTYVAGPSPFNIKAISDEIDRAAAALHPRERGVLIAEVNEGGAGAGLVVRLPQLGPLKPSALVTVTKPKAGRFRWSGGLRVGFLVSESPLPVRVLPDLRGLYRLFRHRGAWPVTAFVKALALANGFAVRLDG